MMPNAPFAAAPLIARSGGYRTQSAPFAAVPTPRLSWVTRSDQPGWRQLAAELAWDDGTKTVNLQLDGDRSVLVDWPFAELLPRQRGTLKIRVWGPDGWSGWSADRTVIGTYRSAPLDASRRSR